MIRKIANLKIRIALVIAVLAFGTLAALYSFNTTRDTGAAYQGDKPSMLKNKVDSIEPSTISETPQLELDTSSQTSDGQVAPSLPPAGEAGYTHACQKAKTSLKSEYDNAVGVENNKYRSNQQIILDRYVRDGLSFSSILKTVQGTETRRHNNELKVLETNYKKQLSSLNC